MEDHRVKELLDQEGVTILPENGLLRNSHSH